MKYNIIKVGDWDRTLLRDVLRMSLRPVDELECSFAGQSTKEAIRHAVDYSEYLTACVCKTSGQPQAIFGVASDHEDMNVGIPWLLATTDFGMDKAWLKECKHNVFPEMQALYPVLRNYVASENKESILWLKWLGFKMHDTEYPQLTLFERRRKHV